MAQSRFSSQSDYPRGPAHVLVVKRTPLRVRFALGALLLLGAYVVFCVANLSPYSKQEFINSFLSPIFRLLGA